NQPHGMHSSYEQGSWLIRAGKDEAFGGQPLAKAGRRSGLERWQAGGRLAGGLSVRLAQSLARRSAGAWPANGGVLGLRSCHETVAKLSFPRHLAALGQGIGPEMVVTEIRGLS